MFTVFTRLWNFRGQTISMGDAADSMHRLLEQKCPICGQGLKNHAYGGIACTRIKDADQASMRARLATGPLDALPNEGANDPESDIIAYVVLRCPDEGAYALLEHFSGAYMWGAEFILVVPDIPTKRMEQLVELAPLWYLL